MKTPIRIISVIFFGILFGCGDDDVVDGLNGTNEVLIYSLDSAVIRSSFTGEQELVRVDSIRTLFDSCRISFESISNCDSAALIELKMLDSTETAFTQIYYSFNQTNTLYGSAVITGNLKSIFIRLWFNNLTGTEKYLIIRNFKIFRIH